MAERFANLIGAMEGIVELATQPVLERLRTWLKDQAPETIDGWELPEVTPAIDSESRLHTEEDEYRALLAIGALSSPMKNYPVNTSLDRIR